MKHLQVIIKVSTIKNYLQKYKTHTRLLKREILKNFFPKQALETPKNPSKENITDSEICYCRNILVWS